MLDPTVVVMRFDLGAMVGLPATNGEQAIGTPRLNQGVEYGTRIPASGTLLWFSPDLKQAPTPVVMTDAARGEIAAGTVRLHLLRTGDRWTVERE